MKYLSVPAMFNEDYLKKLNNLNNLNNSVKIIETYGSIPNFLFGSIRPANTIKQISKKDLIFYIKKSKELNLGFNYIMNTTVFSENEFTDDKKEELIKFIQELINAGMTKITIAIPLLIKFIRKNFPNLHIVASICLNVTSIQEIENLKSLGVNTVVLAKDVNRNFKLLKNIVKNIKEIDIKLLCNTPCLLRCLDLIYHMNVSALQDNYLKSNASSNEYFVSHAALNCQLTRLRNPIEFLKGPWIRPEDLKLYNDLGINFFKIDGRDKPESYVIEVIEAYIKEKFDGNFLYLLQGFYPKNREEFLKIRNMEILKIGIYLENSILDGFLSGFLNNENLCSNGCSNCNYCSTWSKNIEIDKNTKDFYEEHLILKKGD